MMAAASAATTRPLDGGGTKHKKRKTNNGRTLPEWLDPKGQHGQVIVLRMQAVEGSLPTNPFIVEKSVTQLAGKVNDGYMTKDGSLVLKVRNPKQAGTLLQMDKLIDDTRVKVEKHPTLNRTKMFVSCNEVATLDDKTLESELKEKYEILEIRRMTRTVNGTRVNTGGIVITFDGTTAPTEIDIGFYKRTTRPFIPSPMQCFRCFKFGHTKTRCQAAPACRICSKEHPIALDTNNRQVCNEPAWCRNCDGDHQIASRNCPLYKEEELIIQIRSDEGVSLHEARKLAKQRMSEETQASTFAETAGRSSEIELLKGQVRTLLLKVSENEAKLKNFNQTETRANEAEKTLKRLQSDLSKIKQRNQELENSNKNLMAALRQTKKGTLTQHTESEEGMESEEEYPPTNTLTGTKPKVLKPKAKRSKKSTPSEETPAEPQSDSHENAQVPSLVDPPATNRKDRHEARSGAHDRGRSRISNRSDRSRS